MPQFTQWTVPDPSPNILFNPMAVDKAIADNQSTLGNLDINRQTLALAQQKLDATRAGNAVWADGDTTGTTGTTGANGTAVPGGGGSFLGALAQIESGDKNIVSGTDTDSKGLTLAQGGNASEISQGHFQIQTATWKDFAPRAGVDVSKYPNAMSAPREVQAQVASVIPFKRFGPRTQTMMRQQFGPIDSNQTVGTLAGLGPRVGPRVAGNVPMASADPNAPLPVPPIPPAVVPPTNAATTPATTTTGQADDPNTAAVKQAATALLNMPEAEAAVAYGPTVRSLQAQGFAMNAPPTYPGHAALQSLVGGGDATAAAVEPSRVAMRTGGTDTAGPGAGQATLPPDVQPNRMAYGTNLPGVTIGLPTNGMAPPATTAAPVTTAAVPTAAPTPAQGKPPVPIPPPAPSRAIDLTPTIQGGRFDGLTPNQAKAVQSMALSLVPTQEIAARVETWRQQNLANKQAATSNLAAQQQADFDRQKFYLEQQEKTGWEQQPDGSLKNKYTGDTKWPPTPRFTTQEGVGVLAAMPGGDIRLVSPINPAGIITQRSSESQGTEAGKDAGKQLPALMAQGRAATQAMGNIDYGMNQVREAAKSGIPTGYFSQGLATAAAAAKSLGIDTTALGVDPAAVGNIQSAQKTLGVVAGAILQQAIGKDSQITDAKIQHFIHTQPGIETDPHAIERVLNWARSQFVYENEMSTAAVKEAADSPTGTLPLNWHAKYYRDHGFAPIYDQGSGEMKQPDGQQPPREPPKGPPPTAPVNPSERKANTVYSTPKGALTWTGTGWLAPAGVQ